MMSTTEEMEKKSLERDMFGEDPDAILNENQYRAIKTIIDERDELLTENRQAHHILDIIGIPRDDPDGSVLTLLGRMRKVQEKQ